MIKNNQNWDLKVFETEKLTSCSRFLIDTEVPIQLRKWLWTDLNNVIDSRYDNKY